MCTVVAIFCALLITKNCAVVIATYNAKCIFIAGNEIVLSSGFEVEKGGKFEARVYTNDMIE